MRLYLDEDAMDDDLVAALRARGVDLETAGEADLRKREDREQLAHAAEVGRVLYSFNVAHYCALHASMLRRGEAHAGIVVARQQHYSVGEQMRRLLKLAAGRTAEEMQNRLEFLSDWD